MMKSSQEYPLSPNQQGLWALEQRFPGRGLYNDSGAYRPSENLSPATVRRAAARLCARHPALRTTFSERAGVPFQIVHEHLPLDFREFRLEEGDEATVERILDEQVSQHPLDLERGPPIRWTFISIRGQRPILSFTLHHIITDGWSNCTLMPEFGALCREESGGRVADFAPLRHGYHDFIREQDGWLASEAAQQERRFWRETLSGHIPPLNLPVPRLRQESRSFKTDVLPFAIPVSLREAMGRLAKTLNVRPLIPWLSLWFVLLYRLTGHEDPTTTLPVAGRPRKYIGVIGLFVNNLPIRARCAGEEDFRTFVQRTARAVEDALRHQTLPLTLTFGETKTANHTALSQTGFAWQDYNFPGRRDSRVVVTPWGDRGDMVHSGGMTWECVRPWRQPQEVDVQLWIMNPTGNQYGIWYYAQELFEPATMERWSGYLLQLAEGVVAEPETRISQLPLLTEAERQRILVDWNDTGMPYPRNKCVHELFEEQVARDLDAVAVIFEDEEVNYGELNDRANRLAHRLRKLDVRPEVLVGLFVERSVEMVVGLLAILKAGGAYVPLDPEYPAERLAFMAEDAGLKVLLCHGATRDRLPECAARILDMDGEGEAIAGESSENPEQLAEGNNLAYVIHTSGSTGKPKGVMIEHTMVTGHILNIIDLYDLKPADRVLQSASINFDASVDHIFGTLLVGATLILHGTGMCPPEEYLDDVVHYGITVIHMTPVYVHQIFDAAADRLKEIRASDLVLRLINSEGDVLPAETVRRWQEGPLGKARLLNTYGPTETTVTASAFEVPKDWSADTDTVPIGRPLPGRTVYILDDRMHPVPIGIPGELHIGGAGVARGYLNRPDLTAEKFIPDPFSDDPQARLYRTGDLCRWLPDGNIEFLGRIDTQVKIRGFRIECGEVENALRSHPDVREAVVKPQGEGADKQLVAWVGWGELANPNTDVSGDVHVGVRSPHQPTHALRTHLRALVPDWMIPSRFVFVEKLPLTPGGKIDRRALPDLDTDQSSVEAKYVAPRDPVENTLCGIFAQVLGIRRAGIHDNFFDLGGHSLLVIRAMPSIREHFGRELPPRALFQHPTPGELALAIRGHGEWLPTILLPLRTTGSRAPLFCVHPAGGGAFCYRELAKCLPDDQPVHGIQAVGFEGKEEPLTGIEAMATRYLEEITAQWPSGPYHLYGWSFGGVVAFEMAQRLRAAGREVGFLVLADTGHPSWFQEENEPEQDEIMVHLLAETGELDSELVHELRDMARADRLIYLQRRLAHVMNTSRDNQGRESGLPMIENLERFSEIYRANSQALRTYRPAPWEGKLVFLSARERLDPAMGPPHSAWIPLAAGGMEHHVIPGNHFTMHQRPQVREIARILEGILIDGMSG
uniref:Amino acid adenylation domain-containing protein n=1 Tax=Candidatus Kentrum sp. FW TaxID=2126338 RepID=A0A450U260_9GAMM|nr:MAG: amino acid adenylation domain-containing protein [Candidatus Kentron sp. FW]